MASPFRWLACATLRYAVTVVAGLLLAAAFPNFFIAGLAWVAPGLFLAAAVGQRGAEAFRVGYVGGLAFWLASLSWLLNIPVTGLPILGWLALATYLAVFNGAWVWLALRAAPAIAGTPATAATALAGAPRLARLRWALFAAALWVALEILRARLLTGFPWSLLGVSQFQLTPLLQISSVTGVYGVSFLIVWTSVSLLGAGLVVFRSPGARSALVAEAGVPLLVVATVFAVGYHRITHAPAAERTLRVTFVQPAVPQTVIWNRNENAARFTNLVALTRTALTNQTDLLVWPEAALPEFDDASYTVLTNLAAQHRVWFLFGADDVRLRPGATNENAVEFFNAAWLLSPRGLIADTYHKRRLVIFGEYIPLARALPFIAWFTPITGSFTAGAEVGQFPLRDLGVTLAPLICFEDVFPHGAREHVATNTDLLVNLTNDGWFGDGAAQWQHAANAVFRAIENGVPLVRACNTGLTCWVDEHGGIREIFRDEQGTIFGPGHLTLTVPLRAESPPTFYQRHGDVFGWACVALAALVLLSGIRRRPASD